MLYFIVGRELIRSWEGMMITIFHFAGAVGVFGFIFLIGFVVCSILGKGKAAEAFRILALLSTFVAGVLAIVGVFSV